jgi:GNAT superfamily N-acetyltransferase
VRITVDGLEVEIRSGTEADVPLLLSFIHGLAEVEKLTVSATEESLRNALFGARPAAHTLFVFADGKPIGYMVYYFTFSTNAGKRGLWLEDLYVDEAYRRRGIGQALMTHLAGITLENDCARFEWIVLDWNTPAVEFYRKLGATLFPDWTICRLDGASLSRVAAGELSGPETKVQ